MQTAARPESDPARLAFTVAGVLGALAVALGAFGAHALKGFLATAADGAQRLAWWQTATDYHLAHALLAAVCALMVPRFPKATTSLWLCVVGTVLFSGSLYAMTLTNIRVLGAITPLGGVSFIGAWVGLIIAARRPAGG